MLTLLGTTTAIIYKAINWIPEALKRRSETIKQLDSKRLRAQREGNLLLVE